MGGINSITAIDTPRSHDPDRWRVLLQMADLNRGGVGAQQQILLQVKGVLHVPSRVVFGNVQGGEVVVVLLHLRSFGNAVAQTEEEVDDLLGGGDQWMAVPHGNSRGRCGHIKTLPRDPFRHGRLFHRLKAISQQGLHLGLEHVGPLADHRPIGTGEFAHRPQNPRELAFLAQQANAKLFEGLGIHRISDVRCSLLLEGIELFGELLQGDCGAHGLGAMAADCKQPSRLGSHHPTMRPWLPCGS